MSARTVAEATETGRRPRTPRRRSPNTQPAPRTIQTLRAHGRKIVSLLWSLSGRYLATAAQGGVIRIFYVLRGRHGEVRPTPLRTFDGHAADVLAMAFSPNDFLLTASMDRSVRLWHVDTNLCLRRFAHADMVTAVAFHPKDENYVVTGGCDGVVRVWKPTEHACVAEANVGAVVTAAQFDCAGYTAYVGTYDGSLLALDTQSLVPRTSSRRRSPRSPLSASVSASTSASSSSSTSPTTSHDMETGALGLHDSSQVSRAHSHRLSKLLPLLHARSTMSIRPRRSRRKVPAPRVCGLALDVRRDEIVASGSDSRVHVVREENEPEVRARLRVPSSRRDDAALKLGSSLSHDGRFLLLDCTADELRLVDMRKGRALQGGGRRVKERELVLAAEGLDMGGGGSVSCAAFATEGAWLNAWHGRKQRGFLLAVGADDGTVRIMLSEEQEA